jgi:hypothetical protein
MKSVRYFCPEVLNMKYHGNTSSGSRTDVHMYVDKGMDGWHDESDRHFSGQKKKLKLILSSETQNQPKNQLLQKKHKIKVIISQQIL